MSAGGAKLQPIAALCAVLLLLWGADAVASVIAQIQINHKLDLWPDTVHSWAAWSIWLAFAAAVIGVAAIVCGIVGFRSRLGLHLGGLVVLASIACTLVALVIDNVKFHVPWFGNDQSLWLNYRYGLTWHALPSGLGFQRWWFFAEYLLLPLAVVVLLVWLLAILTGAGRRPAPSGAVGYAYVAAPQADYRYLMAEDASAPEEAEPAREAPPTTEPRDVPTPSATSEVAPDDVAPVEAAPVEAPPVEAAPVEDAPVEVEERPADDARVWFVTVQGADHGPYSRTQLQSYLDEGRLHSGTTTHLAGGEDRPLAEVLA